jgi:hypothetical protein
MRSKEESEKSTKDSTVKKNSTTLPQKSTRNEKPKQSTKNSPAPPQLQFIKTPPKNSPKKTMLNSTSNGSSSSSGSDGDNSTSSGSSSSSSSSSDDDNDGDSNQPIKRKTRVLFDSEDDDPTGQPNRSVKQSKQAGTQGKNQGNKMIQLMEAPTIVVGSVGKDVETRAEIEKNPQNQATSLTSFDIFATQCEIDSELFEDSDFGDIIPIQPNSTQLPQSELSPFSLLSQPILTSSPQSTQPIQIQSQSPKTISQPPSQSSLTTPKTLLLDKFPTPISRPTAPTAPTAISSLVSTSVPTTTPTTVPTITQTMTLTSAPITTAATMVSTIPTSAPSSNKSNSLQEILRNSLQNEQSNREKFIVDSKLAPKKQPTMRLTTTTSGLPISSGSIFSLSKGVATGTRPNIKFDPFLSKSKRLGSTIQPKTSFHYDSSVSDFSDIDLCDYDDSGNVNSRTDNGMNDNNDNITDKSNINESSNSKNNNIDNINAINSINNNDDGKNNRDLNLSNDKPQNDSTNLIPNSVNSQLLPNTSNPSNPSNPSSLQDVMSGLYSQSSFKRPTQAFNTNICNSLVVVNSSEISPTATTSKTSNTETNDNILNTTPTISNNNVNNSDDLTISVLNSPIVTTKPTSVSHTGQSPSTYKLVSKSKLTHPAFDSILPKIAPQLKLFPKTASSSHRVNLTPSLEDDDYDYDYDYDDDDIDPFDDDFVEKQASKKIVKKTQPPQSSKRLSKDQDAHLKEDVRNFILVSLPKCGQNKEYSTMHGYRCDESITRVWKAMCAFTHRLSKLLDQYVSVGDNNNNNNNNKRSKREDIFDEELDRIQQGEDIGHLLKEIYGGKHSSQVKLAINSLVSRQDDVHTMPCDFPPLPTVVKDKHLPDGFDYRIYPRFRPLPDLPWVEKVQQPLRCDEPGCKEQFRQFSEYRDHCLAVHNKHACGGVYYSTPKLTRGVKRDRSSDYWGVENTIDDIDSASFDNNEKNKLVHDDSVDLKKSNKLMRSNKMFDGGDGDDNDDDDGGGGWDSHELVSKNTPVKNKNTSLINKSFQVSHQPPASSATKPFPFVYNFKLEIQTFYCLKTFGKLPSVFLHKPQHVLQYFHLPCGLIYSDKKAIKKHIETCEFYHQWLDPKPIESNEPNSNDNTAVVSSSNTKPPSNTNPSRSSSVTTTSNNSSNKKKNIPIFKCPKCPSTPSPHFRTIVDTIIHYHLCHAVSPDDVHQMELQEQYLDHRFEYFPPKPSQIDGHFIYPSDVDERSDSDDVEDLAADDHDDDDDSFVSDKSRPRLLVKNNIQDIQSGDDTNDNDGDNDEDNNFTQNSKKKLKNRFKQKSKESSPLVNTNYDDIIELDEDAFRPSFSNRSSIIDHNERKTCRHGSAHAPTHIPIKAPAIVRFESRQIRKLNKIDSKIQNQINKNDFDGDNDDNFMVDNNNSTQVLQKYKFGIDAQKDSNSCVNNDYYNDNFNNNDDLINSLQRRHVTPTQPTPRDRSFDKFIIFLTPELRGYLEGFKKKSQPKYWFMNFLGSEIIE